MQQDQLSKQIQSLIRDVPDFPKEGIIFKDLTPVFKDGPTFRAMADYWAERYRDMKIDAFVAVESRGFIVGAPVSALMNIGLVLVRKPGKLPGAVVRQTYELEYGTDTLEMVSDAIQPGMRVVLFDDLLATGGTIGAVSTLVRSQGAEIIEAAFAVELGFLNGRQKLSDIPCHSLVVY